MTQVPDVLVTTIRIFPGRSHRHVVVARVIQGVLARLNRPFPPWRNHSQMWRQGLISQLKSHLVVTLARATMSQRISAALQRNFHLALGEDRPRQSSAQEILPFVNGPGLQCLPEIVGYEFAAQVLDKNPGGPRAQSLLPDSGIVLALSDVAYHGDNLAV